MYHTRALALRKDEWREADVLFTVLTDDFGKIRLLAQGARKHGAKIQGHLEPGSIADISLVAGRNGYRLTTARLANYFSNTRRSLEKLAVRDAILRIVDANLFEERDESRTLFGSVAETLQLLDTDAVTRPYHILWWFTVRFLDYLGVLPSADSLEAAHIPLLLALGSRALADIGNAAVDETEITRELQWLGGRLGSSIEIIPTVRPLGLAV